MIPLFRLEESRSTNDEILDFLLLKNEAAAVFTLNQTQGKGQYGNRWQNIPGQNLAYSLAVPCRSLVMAQNLFNYHTACLVRDFIAKMTSEPVEIKWPNDIILKGKKICGMLTEKVPVRGTDFYIVGIGINVLQTDFSALPKAGSIASQTGLTIDIESFSNEFHHFISNEIFINKNPDAVLDEFNKNLFRKNEISVFEKDGVRQNGIIQFADGDGFLWIDLENEGLQKFFHKEIELLY